MYASHWRARLTASLLRDRVRVPTLTRSRAPRVVYGWLRIKSGLHLTQLLILPMLNMYITPPSINLSGATRKNRLRTLEQPQRRTASHGAHGAAQGVDSRRRAW